MYRVSKRVLDLVAAALGLAVLSPVLVVIGTSVLLTSGRPVFFRQVRSGKGGRPFRMVKFRTMNDNRDAAGELLPDGERIDRLGAFLRRSSLDELPELWNVLRGQMSLVGPRPLLPEYDSLYSAEQARRLEVKPGITGLAQVGGRNALSWDDKFALDVRYVEEASMSTDLQILTKTFQVVIGREGISQEGEATARRFTGNAPDSGRNG